MSDDTLTESYAAARDKICNRVFSAIHNLTKSLDEFMPDVGNRPSKFVEAYNARINLKFGEPQNTYTSSLASLDHMEHLHGFLAAMFKGREADFVRIANADSNVRLMEKITEAGSKIAVVNSEIRAFRKKFAGDITQEEASPQYRADASIVREVGNDFYDAATGQWEGEFKVAENSGKAQLVETRNSTAVRRVGHAYRSGNMKFLGEFLNL